MSLIMQFLFPLQPRFPSAMSPAPCEFMRPACKRPLPPANRKTPPPHFHVTGKMAQVRDLIATASLFGWNLSRGWDMSGPVMCDLQWQGGPFLWNRLRTGMSNGDRRTRATNGASLSAPFLNQPVGQIAARVDLKPRRHAYRANVGASIRRSLEWDPRPSRYGGWLEFRAHGGPSRYFEFECLAQPARA